MNIILYIMNGLIAGTLTGLGVGGGTVLILILINFLKLSQIHAQFINLFYIIPTAIIATYINIRNKNIEFKYLIYILPFCMIGSFIGSMIATNIDINILKNIFAIFLLVLGIYELIFNKDKN